MVAYVPNTYFSPYSVHKVMNAFVLGIVLHVVFEHFSFPRDHPKNAHGAQLRIFVD
jgi:hypothetical protein